MPEGQEDVEHGSAERKLVRDRSCRHAHTLQRNILGCKVCWGTLAGPPPPPGSSPRRRPALHLTFGLLASSAAAHPASAQDSAPLDGQVALVTGSTSGMGRVLAFRLAELGAEVIVHGRNAEAGAAVVDSIRRAGGRAAFHGADLGAMDEVRGLAATVEAEYARRDILVNDAGVGPGPNERLLSADGLELRFHVNYLAGYQLTHLLLPLLRASAPSQVVMVASRTQSALDFDDVMLASGFRGIRAYGQSKLAQIMFTFDLAPELEGSGVRINAVHPAPVMDTRMMEVAGARPQSTPEDGARSVLNVILSGEGWNGRYFHELEPGRALDQAYDPEARARLREVSRGLTNVPSGGDLNGAGPGRDPGLAPPRASA
ncbi:MAG: SDR family NAD(P)-dependent oxidoreductase [Longimicrobiales bacterium]